MVKTLSAGVIVWAARASVTKMGVVNACKGAAVPEATLELPKATTPAGIESI